MLQRQLGEGGAQRWRFWFAPCPPLCLASISCLQTSKNMKIKVTQEKRKNSQGVKTLASFKKLKSSHPEMPQDSLSGCHVCLIDL